MKNFKLFFLITMAEGLLILSAACQANTDVPNATNIKVFTALPARDILNTEEISFSNCDANNIEITQTLGAIETIQKLSEVKTVAVSRDSEGSEYEIPELLKLQLEIEIENSYQQIYQSTISRLENVSISAAPGFETVYLIQWEQLDYRGDVSFSLANRVYEVDYLYQLIVPKLLSKEEIDCAGNVQTVTSSPQPAQGMTDTPSLPLTTHKLTLRTDTYLYLGPQMAYGTTDPKRRSLGEEFNVVARNPFGDWFLVQGADGMRGWLYVEWVIFTFDPKLIPITEDYPPAPAPPATRTKQQPSLPPIPYP